MQKVMSCCMWFFYDREMTLQYGLWDQIRVDHGKEFYLMLYVQEVLSQFRTNVRRAPHMQSTSRQVRNHDN